MANTGTRDVIVIGGGIAGVATAFFLAREGADVALLERDGVNAHASGANAGSIHLQIPVAEYRTLGRGWAEAFAPTLAMLRAGADLWEELPDLLGADLEFRRSGGVIAARDEAEMALVREKAALEARHGVEMELLDGPALRRLAPYLARGMEGGALYPGEGKANPLIATRALARAAAAAGATILTGAEVTGLEPGEGFTVLAGERRFRARSVVCAAGADAGRIAAMAGLDLPIRGFPLQVSVTEPAAPLIGHLVYSAAGKLTLKQMANGACLIGGGWPSLLRPDGGLTISDRSLAPNLALARAVVPALAELRIVRTWPAMVNGTDSWRPILGEARRAPGLYFCLFPWMGFTAGPIAGRCVAEMILGRAPALDLAALSETPA